MASIRKIRDGCYELRYRTPEGKSRRKRFALKKDAERDLINTEHRKETGTYIDPRDGQTTLSHYAETWAASKVNVRERTRINVEGRLRKNILPAFGARRMSSIRPSDVRAWVAELSAELAPSTVKATFLTFGQIMRTAEVDGLISRSPCIGVELPAETSHEENALPQRRAGRRARRSSRGPLPGRDLDGRLYRTPSGRALGAHASEAHLLKRTVEVVESLSEVRGALVMGPTKTRTRRTVTLPAFLVEMIGEHIARYPSESGHVFTSPGGGPVRHRNYMARHFGAAVEASGLPAGLRFHDLRHTCAAILIAQGWNPKQIQARLGHASVRTSLDRYGHLFDGHDADLLEGLDSVVRAARVSKPCQSSVMELSRKAEGAR